MQPQDTDSGPQMAITASQVARRWNTPANEQRAQEAAQKIARQRLTLDQRKQRMEEKREATSTQGQQVRYVVEVEGVEPGEVGALDE